MNSKVRHQLEQALVYIDSNLDKKLSAEQIASQAYMSKFHFQRLFSELMGETLNQYVLHRRLERAAKILVTEKSMNIKTVATNSGFENHSYFSRAFKKHFNISPVDFRKCFDGDIMGQDAARPFLKTISSKFKAIDVAVEDYPTLWCNHKRTVKSNKRDKGSYDESWLKVKHAFDEIQRSHTSNLFGIGTYCDCASMTDPQRTTVPMLYGALYDERNEDAWSSDWLEVEAGLWVVCTHYGDYEYKYQTRNKVIRSWLPDSGYELRNTMNFEVFLNCPAPEKPDNLVMQMYIPIKKVGDDIHSSCD